MSSEKFCLRWNDFEGNISSAFREMRDDKDFFDVTLACDEDQIQAHKVIISACSPFFRNVLRRNSHSHPLLYLKGVKYTDLQAVLNFMYHGEVNVAQEELNSFLAVAEDLKVKGLTQNKAGSKTNKQISNIKTVNDLPVSKTLEKPLNRGPGPLLAKPPRSRPSVQQQPREDEIQEVVPIKSEPHDNTICQRNSIMHPAKLSHTQPMVVVEGASSLTNYEEEEVYDAHGEYGAQYQHQEQMPINHSYGGCIEEGQGGDYEPPKSPSDLLSFCSKSPASNKWECGICGQFSHNGRHQVRNHVESKHFPTTFQYQCEYCEKITNTRKGLERHLSEKHRNHNSNSNY